MPDRPTLPTHAPPALRRWDATWRFLAALFTGFIVLIASAYEVPPERGWIILLDVAFGIVALVLLPLRRRRPLTTALVVSVISGVSASSVGALGIIVISLATRRRWREVLPVGVAWVGGGFLYEWVLDPAVPTPWWVLALSSSLVYVVCVAIGFYIGGRRETFANLEERAVQAEREQTARVEQARTAERSRIAREMHDVLAHRISLVAMHSGALAYREDLTREETVATATIIRDNAHLALTELREVLGVLRDTDAAEDAAAGLPERPQPTLAALDDIVEESRTAGTAVTCSPASTSADVLATLPDTTSRNAFRILQEALTNARKHAPGAAVTVEITGEPGERVNISVRNPLLEPATLGPGDPRTADALPESGMGLTGLAERAKLAGGELTHGVDQGGHFFVRAWLPWPS